MSHSEEFANLLYYYLDWTIEHFYFKGNFSYFSFFTKLDQRILNAAYLFVLSLWPNTVAHNMIIQRIN